MNDSKSKPKDANQPMAEPKLDKSESLIDTNDEGLEKKPKVVETKNEEDDIEYPHGLKLAVILGALCLAVFLVALDQTIISTAIPKM